MRKRTLTLLCMLLCLAVFLAACVPADDIEDPETSPDVTPSPEPPGRTVFVVDFSDGNTGFLKLNFGAIDADLNASFDVTTMVDGSSALKLTAPSGGRIHLGINVDGMLGERVVDVQTAVFEIYAEFPGGRFAAQTGEITAYMGGLDESDSQTWTVYLETRNPNNGIFTFDDDSGFIAGGHNIFEFVRLVDRATEPAIIYIKSITFFDSDNVAIPVDTTAEWAGPPGYAVVVEIIEHELPLPADTSGGFHEWFTPGTDNKEDDYMPWQVLAASRGIVFDMDDPGDSFGFVFMGAGNNWSWTQIDGAGDWADGRLTIRWDDIDFDTSTINEEDSAFKIFFGNWGDVNITRAALLIPDNLDF